MKKTKMITWSYVRQIKDEDTREKIASIWYVKRFGNEVDFETFVKAVLESAPMMVF